MGFLDKVNDLSDIPVRFPPIIIFINLRIGPINPRLGNLLFNPWVRVIPEPIYYFGVEVTSAIKILWLLVV